jgi:hypothetical protein
MTLATMTTSLAKGTLSTNPFAELDNDSTGQHKGMTDNDASAHDDGGSQPLLNNNTPTKDARSQSLPVDIMPPEDAPGDTTAASRLQDAFAKHNQVMTSAIADVTATATMPNTATHTTATAKDGMAQTATTLVTTNPMLADLMAFMERGFSQSRADSCAIRDRLDAVDTDDKLLRAAIGAKADSTKNACLDFRLTTVAATIRESIESKLTTLGLAVLKMTGTILDLKANLQHVTKKVTTVDTTTQFRLNEILLDTQSWFNALTSKYKAQLSVIKSTIDRLLRPRSLTTHGDRGMKRRVGLEYLGYLRLYTNTPPRFVA